MPRARIANPSVFRRGSACIESPRRVIARLSARLADRLAGARPDEALVIYQARLDPLVATAQPKRLRIGCAP